jgi:hypothetical protein
MKVKQIQQYMSNLITLLQEGGGKGPAADLERLAQALEPFQEMGLAEFGELLRKAEEYQRTGALSAPQPRVRSKPICDPEKVRGALDHVRRLYDRATEEGFSFQEIHDEIQRLDKSLNKEEALALAEQFEVVGSFETKPQAIEGVGRKISQRKADHDRSKWITSGGSPDPTNIDQES